MLDAHARDETPQIFTKGEDSTKDDDDDDEEEEDDTTTLLNDV